MRISDWSSDVCSADGTLELRGVSKPVTLTFTWTPGAAPVLAGKATVKRLDFGVGGGDWADTDAIPNEVAVSTRVVLKPAQSTARPATSDCSPPATPPTRKRCPHDKTVSPQ